MTTQFIIDKIQVKRGTTADRLAIIPDDGEPIKDQDTGELFLGDGVTAGGNPVGGISSGISQGAADARYVRLSQINVANGVAGLDAGGFVGETNLPLPPVDLTVLLENKLA